MTADNGFMAFLSSDNATLGNQVAAGGNCSATYSFSGVTLTPGVVNYLQIEAVNWGGAGGFIGDFTLSDTSFHFANGTQYLLTEPVEWSGIYNDGNTSVTSQSWIAPTYAVYSEGYNGVGPWGLRGGIDSDAQWIWTSDSWVCGNCTIDLSVAIYPNAVSPEPGTMVMLGSGILAITGALRRKLFL